ncbi:hypothetical protein D018_3976B, partial [Vibrio parahaemolyticus VP2007-007]
LKTLLDPTLLLCVSHVHVFSTDGTAVSFLEGCVNVFQLHGFLPNSKRTYVESFFEVVFGKIMKCWV